MDEKNRTEQLNRLLDDLLADRTRGGEQSGDDLLPIAGRLAAARDLGHRSRSREALRTGLLSQFPVSNHTMAIPRFFLRLATFGALLLFVVVGLNWLLTGAGRVPDPAAAPSASPTPEPEAVPTGSAELPSPLNMDSDSETIRLRLLFSHTFWQRMWVDARLDDLSLVSQSLPFEVFSSGESNAYLDGLNYVSSQRIQIWIEKQTRVRVLVGPVDGAPMEDWILEDLSGEVYNPPTTESQTIQPHPMTGIVPTPISSLLFPAGLAQRGGSYHPVAIETFAGREALVVDWTSPWGEVVDRLWVDTITGVILRQLNAGKDSGGGVTTDYRITAISYDTTFPSAIFDAGATIPPAFASRSDEIPSSTSAPTPAGPSETSLEYGEIYLQLHANRDFITVGMVRFPAACLVTGALCPQPETVPGRPEGEGVQPSWSPDGTQLAYPLIGMADEFWMFLRPADYWIKVDQARFFSGIVWSPDSDWMAGGPMISGDPPGTPIVIVRQDGFVWQEFLGDQPGYKSPIGWADWQSLLFVNMLDNETSDEDSFVYSEISILHMGDRLDTGEVEILTGLRWDVNATQFGMPVLSPDRTKIVYTLSNREDGTTEVVIYDLDTRSSTSFVYDKFVSATRWLVGDELVLTAILGQGCEIHLVSWDGGEDRLLYTRDWGYSCLSTWSPDGAFLLVSEYPRTPTMPRLTVIDVVTGEARIVELPDVGIPFETSTAAWLP